MTKEEAIDYLENYRKMYADLAPERFLEALDCILSQPSLPSNMDEAAEESAKRWRKNTDGSESRELFLQPHIRGFKAGAEWMAGQGWHDAVETPSIFGVYLLIHEKGWCVANYMGKGVVNESGWVEAIHHVSVDEPQKWFDLRDLIPKKQ